MSNLEEDDEAQCVQNTSLQSLACRVALHRAGILQDALAESIWCKLLRLHSHLDPYLTIKEPIINRGLQFNVFLGTYIRVKAVDDALDRLPINVVVSLGCGFDTRITRHPNKTFYGVDSISAKFAPLKSISCDIRRHTQWLSQLVKQYAFNPKEPCIILIECLLMYLQQEDVQQLIEFICENIPKGQLSIFEPVFPDEQDLFGEKMVQNLHGLIKNKMNLKDYMKILIPFYPKIESKSMLDLEAEYIDVLNSHQALRLDEREEWEMLARHYRLILAGK